MSRFRSATRCTTSLVSKRFLQTTTQSPPPLSLHSTSPLIRPHHQHHIQCLAKDEDFAIYTDFLNVEEQEALVGMGLAKLGRGRRRRRGRPIEVGESRQVGDGIQRLFVGEYEFEEGHYDSVIHHFRESLVSTLPPSPSPTLLRTLAKLYNTFPLLPSPLPPNPSETDLPPPGTLTHFLHLSPEGDIGPHVDNLEASGGVILGLSLGAERTLRLVRKKGEGEDGWDVRLPSGSVYIQR
ncbi:hypothetical protein B9479_006506 [Cryptococcus floricola]|uniref:Alpha-ketoglutarate-dependent dioxygenase AlkB-like domain-containing protein n=1 Tax=Cryptococcus floricola TaxID=2591691 RepID=A0A5D3ARQ2_9TREE|nr:hypothetical protein B9479_006506 [Cryptococcus floricola]